MKEFARAFYSSDAWKNCRDAYRRKARGLCEICLAAGRYTPGEIVHHKKHLTPYNINDPRITLSFDNLQLVCRECHAAIHTAKQSRYIVDEFGHVTGIR